MTDAETLRAAAEVLRQRTAREYLARECAFTADRLDAEDAARDWPLAKVAADAFAATFGANIESEERWLITARAVREAIEAEQ